MQGICVHAHCALWVSVPLPVLLPGDGGRCHKPGIVGKDGLRSKETAQPQKPRREEHQGLHGRCDVRAGSCKGVLN